MTIVGAQVEIVILLDFNDVLIHGAFGFDETLDQVYAVNGVT